MKMKMLKLKTVRKAWTANRADPTAVVSWTISIGSWFKMELISSWVVEERVRVFRKNFWSQNSWWATKLFDALEARWEAQQASYNEDPMGRLSDYE
jgi:hypothetical protein